MWKLAEQLADFPVLTQVIVPDLWQQEAVAALRAGKDVVVQAPTGAGKTLIFELWSNQGKPRGQAIYTVPTRALANDKLAEWRARQWDVGIATGDLAENLGAPVVVATLETQKHRLIRGEGPSLLVVDEYQMLGDPERGLNYELALALAPATTQLLLFSGSVANPQDVVQWLRRLGRDAVLVRHDERPVPLEEVHAEGLSFSVPSEIRGYWPRLAARALAEDLGPMLIFAPRRQAAESIASELARYLPTPNPLSLRADQKQLVGEDLGRMLKNRVAYHHSGLSYGARAGVIEPLAKAGQLRVVVATMGLAAGINFSLRSVVLAGESYRRDYVEQPLRPHEILQMIGRAGRRGIDEIGYFIVSANEIRLRDGYPTHLYRSGLVDWAALLNVMAVAAEQGREPFAEAVRVQGRLFSSKPVVLGVEASLQTPGTPCGLRHDAERARHVRQRRRLFWNSRGEWQPLPKPEPRPLRDIQVVDAPALTARLRTVSPASSGESTEAAVPGDLVELRLPGLPEPRRVSVHGLAGAPVPLRPLLSDSAALHECKLGEGTVTVLSEENGRPTYGRIQTVAEVLNTGRVQLLRWMRKRTGLHASSFSPEVWQQRIVPQVLDTLARQKKTPVLRLERRGREIAAVVRLDELTLPVPVDAHGVALWNPVTREVLAEDCARCPLVPACRQQSAETGTAMLWKRLGLIDEAGVPTRRGRVVSFLPQGYGLGVAAALEVEDLPLDTLIYELANLDAGFRFAGEENNRWAGRLPEACHKVYGQRPAPGRGRPAQASNSRAPNPAAPDRPALKRRPETPILWNLPGYLENGLPPRYGAGAEQIVESVHKDPASKGAWIAVWRKENVLLGSGDIDRVIIEWRSLLRQIANAPPLEWPRWTALQAMARGILRETESPTLTNLPPLDFAQTRRIDHRLILRRH